MYNVKLELFEKCLVANAVELITVNKTDKWTEMKRCIPRNKKKLWNLGKISQLLVLIKTV